MQISLRSHLIAGTAAIVGAGAIAVNPVMGAQLSLPSINVPAAAQVGLAAFDSPLAQLFATLDVANNYLLNSTSDPTGLASAVYWPGANFGTTWGVPPTNIPALPATLSQAALGGYSSVGVVSQFIDDALPIISQLGYNGLNYLNVTGNALSAAGIVLTQSVWDAAGLLLQGNISLALTEISTAISFAGQELLFAGGYVLNNVIAKASAVVATLVGSLPQVLAVTAAQAAVVAASASAVLTNTVTALSSGNIQAAWNYAVDGLLGPSGIPGALLNLSIGAGIQTGPIVPSNPADPTTYPAAIAAVFVPSTRTLVQVLSNEIVADLQVEAAPAAAAPSAAAARSAAATEAAPAAEAAAGDSTAAATGSAPAEKPAAHRAARKAAKAAG